MPCLVSSRFLRAHCVHRHTAPLRPRAFQLSLSHSTCLGLALQLASAFNQPLSFDTSSVTNMRSMFYVRTPARVPCPQCPAGSSVHAASAAIAATRPRTHPAAALATPPRASV